MHQCTHVQGYLGAVPRCTCAPRQPWIDGPTHPHPCVHPHLHLSPSWCLPAPRHQCSHAQLHQVHLHGALSACTQQCIPVLMHQHTGASRLKCTYSPSAPMHGWSKHRVSSTACTHRCIHARAQQIHLQSTPMHRGPTQQCRVTQTDRMHSHPGAPMHRYIRCAYPAAVPAASCTEHPLKSRRAAPHSPPRRTCPGVS